MSKTVVAQYSSNNFFLSMVSINSFRKNKEKWWQIFFNQYPWWLAEFAEIIDDWCWTQTAADTWADEDCGRLYTLLAIIHTKSPMLEWVCMFSCQTGALTGWHLSFLDGEYIEAILFFFTHKNHRNCIRNP